MKRKLTLLTNFVQSVLVAMFFLFSIGEIRAQLPYSPAHFGTGNTATINGVKVTRSFGGNADKIDLNGFTPRNIYLIRPNP